MTYNYYALFFVENTAVVFDC